MTSSVIRDHNPSKNAFTNSGHQVEVLSEMISFMENCSVQTKKCKLPFQNGIIMSCKSLLSLFEEMKLKFDISFIITRRLNQDILENFFPLICQMGRAYEAPLALRIDLRVTCWEEELF